MKLQDICTVFTDGDWIESKDQADEGIRLVQTGNIGEGKYLEKESRAKYVSEETFERLKCTEIFPGDILVSRLPEPVGRACIIPDKDERMITAVDCTICRPDEKLILKEYLCYFMQSNAYYTRLLGNVTGTTRKRISRKNLGNVDLSVPQIETQRDIVNRLDRLVCVIESRQKEIRLLDELIKARFVEMFGDQRANSIGLPKGTLKDVADIYLGLTHTPEYVDSGRPFLSVRDISSGVIDFSNCHYITEDEFISLPKGARPKENDLLFCRVGTIGKPVIIPEGTPEFGTFVSVGFLRKKDNVLNTYLKAWMENEYFMEQVYQNVKGASQVNLNTGWLKEFEILIPSMEKQLEFDNFCKQLDKSKVAVQAALDKAQLLFDSLMQEYFG